MTCKRCQSGVQRIGNDRTCLLKLGVVWLVLTVIVVEGIWNYSAEAAENALAALAKEAAAAPAPEIAYVMAQFTSHVLETNPDDFKKKLSYEAALANKRIVPLLSDEQKVQFSKEMAILTARFLSKPVQDIETTKAEFAYEASLVTSHILVEEKTAVSSSKMLRLNQEIENPAALLSAPAGKAVVPPAKRADLSPESYKNLVSDLEQVSTKGTQKWPKFQTEGELRYHYAFNRGTLTSNQDASGFRLRWSWAARLNPEWSVNGMVEGERRLVNFDNKLSMARLNVVRKRGPVQMQAGSFGYLMAEGNIYDSEFKGVKIDVAGPVHYGLGYGETDTAKKVAVVTAKYRQPDYDFEVGGYRYTEDDTGLKNNLWSAGGNYNFDSFSIGAMAIGSSQKDQSGKNMGYVLGIHYGELKTWRAGTFDMFAKYYKQPRHTYMIHTMNGMADYLDGFKGVGAGIHYSFAPNLVGGIECYRLSDLNTGYRGNTWWSDVTYYF